MYQFYILYYIFFQFTRRPSTRYSRRNGQPSSTLAAAANTNSSTSQMQSSSGRGDYAQMNGSLNRSTAKRWLYQDTYYTPRQNRTEIQALLTKVAHPQRIWGHLNCSSHHIKRNPNWIWFSSCSLTSITKTKWCSPKSLALLRYWDKYHFKL